MLLETHGIHCVYVNTLLETASLLVSAKYNKFQLFCASSEI